MAVLSGDEIKRRLVIEKLDAEIFVKGTWDASGLRGAAYDLRIATDLLILPDGKRYWADGPPGYQRRKASFLIEPKQVAFVSTAEELRMPLELAGNIAPRFRGALRGLLVMGGMLVDPGYRGRLHFQLANIGDKPFEVVPEKTSVAALQLMPVEGGMEIAERRKPSSERLLDELFHPQAKDPLPPLAFFSDVGALQGDLGNVKEDLTEQKTKLDSTKRSTDQLLVFGVFLVSITLFVAAAGVLISAIAGGSIDAAAHTVTKTELTFPGLVVAVALLAVVGIACWAMMRPVWKVISAQNEKDEKG